jgi:hypothetical protein
MRVFGYCQVRYRPEELQVQLDQSLDVFWALRHPLHCASELAISVIAAPWCIRRISGDDAV